MKAGAWRHGTHWKIWVYSSFLLIELGLGRIWIRVWRFSFECDRTSREFSSFKRWQVAVRFSYTVDLASTTAAERPPKSSLNLSPSTRRRAGA